jgi:hypothetical protein
MQSERVHICTKQFLQSPPIHVWFEPLTVDASVHDILRLFAEYALQRNALDYPLLQQCFDTLLSSQEECMFVFMRRWSSEAAGILRSQKPLCSDREKFLLGQLGEEPPWNVPLWTWCEKNGNLTESLETQCRRQQVHGPCMAIFCYR